MKECLKAIESQLSKLVIVGFLFYVCRVLVLILLFRLIKKIVEANGKTLSSSAY